MGTLFLVATPIGNLRDMTHRAIEVLGQVDIIACEDTRRTRALLTHFEIAAPRLESLPAHDEERRAGRVAQWVSEGKNVALVTDAGTPAISDPGRRVVAAVVAAGAKVVPIPGPSAVTAALSVSGLDTARFHFYGFLPRKGAERGRLLEEASRLRGASVFYEAPTRTGGTLADLAERFGDERVAVLCREITKVHEELARGTLAELKQRFADGARGEVTIVVAGTSERVAPVDFDEAVEMVRARIDGGERLKDACREVAGESGQSSRDLYQALLE